MQTEIAKAPRGARPNEIVRNWMIGCLLLIALLTIITLGARVFAPIFLAIFVAAVLRAPVRGLMKLGLPQALSAGLVFLLFAGFLVSLVLLVYEPATKWMGELPVVTHKVEQKLVPLRRALAKAAATAERIEDATTLSNGTSKAVEIKTPSLIDRVFKNSTVLLIQSAVVLVLAFFMIAIRKPIISERVISLAGGHGDRFRASLVEIERQLSRYFGATTLLNVGVGVVTSIAMWLCHMPNPLLWGALAAVLQFVPYAGPAITACSIAAAGFVTFDTWPEILAPVLAFLVIHVMEGEFITPLVIGRIMTLHPVLIFVFVMLWGWMWGLAGAFLAVPILVTSMIVARNLMIGESTSLEDVIFPRDWASIMSSDDPYPTIDPVAPTEPVTVSVTGTL